MKKSIILFLILIVSFLLTGCDLLTQDDNVVDLGNGETAIKWNLVINDNEYRPVQSAYFEFNEDTFKYYEEGILKKE